MFLLALSFVLTPVMAEAKALPKNSVGTKQLRNKAVTTPKIRNNAVTTPKIRNNAVTTSKIRNGAVTAAKLGAGAQPAGMALDTTTGTVALNALNQVIRTLAFTAPSNGYIQISSGGNMQCITATDHAQYAFKVTRSDTTVVQSQIGRSNATWHGGNWHRWSLNWATTVTAGATTVELIAQCWRSLNVAGTGTIWTEHVSVIFVPAAY